MTSNVVILPTRHSVHSGPPFTLAPNGLHSAHLPICPLLPANSLHLPNHPVQGLVCVLRLSLLPLPAISSLCSVLFHLTHPSSALSPLSSKCWPPGSLLGGMDGVPLSWVPAAPVLPSATAVSQRQWLTCLSSGKALMACVFYF